MTDVRIARGLDEVPPGPSAVTIGFFDGVHRGHRSIIGRAVRRAEDGALRSVAVTFDRHPMEVVDPAAQPPLLMTLERRVATLVETGVDLVVVLEFTTDLSELPPDEFVGRVLVDVLDARAVVVGTNFRFGRRAAGDVERLAELGAARGFDVEAVSLLRLGDVPISSTAIREHVGRGDVEWAAEALGRPFALEGPVVRGDARGRELGVPTANIEVSARMQLPANGVYAGHVEVDGRGQPAVTNVGTRPTFRGDGVTVEAHLIDWDGDIYGRHALVEFRHRLRDELAFESVDELIAAMQDDIARGRSLLAS